MNNFAVKSTKCGKSLWSVYEGLAFQSTPPRGRRRICDSLPRFYKDFNPRLREGGDILKFYQTNLPIISIHASAREATNATTVDITWVMISIHASAREATPVGTNMILYLRFQSTPPRGRRPIAKRVVLVVQHFNPLLREGGDGYCKTRGFSCAAFQSTPPRGRRHHLLSIK